jgi:hypothetical protein
LVIKLAHEGKAAREIAKQVLISKTCWKIVIYIVRDDLDNGEESRKQRWPKNIEIVYGVIPYR